MVNSYPEFLELLARHESQGNGDYQAKNGQFLGRYQMGEAALMDAGYMMADSWCGKNGITCEEDFLCSPRAQEDAILAYHTKVWSYIKHADLDCYVGKTIKGVEITPYGLIAAAHLKGIGLKNGKYNHEQGLRHYLESGGLIDPTDANGTPVSKYLKNMAGYHRDGTPSPFDRDTNETRILRKGSKGEDVKKLQNMLNQLGVNPPLEEDGAFGSKTETAVKEFQQDYGLKKDGIVGPKTWKALDAALEAAKKQATLSTGNEAMDRALASYMGDQSPGTSIPFSPKNSGDLSRA